jgi:hypothetical protein
MGPTPKCHFVLKLSNGSFEILAPGILTTLGPHNFVCKPHIEMRYESKVIALIESFLMVCCMPSERKEIRAIPDF